MRFRYRFSRLIGLSFFLFASSGCSRTPENWRTFEATCLTPAGVLIDGFAGFPEARSTFIVDEAIADASIVHDVSPELIRAVIQTESEYDPLAVSARGACGLMQLMPSTAERFGASDCFDPRQNILAGTRFLKTLLTRYRGSIDLSIAAYNAGETAVARHRGVPPFAQTRAYVRRVQALLKSPDLQS
jgi:soluble lytic murein transglycosylase-like protein